MTDLDAYAAGFPSRGGSLNGALLRELAARVPDGMAIVELGTWLGAATAQLALGLSGRASPPTIHSFDYFVVTEGDFAWAEARGLGLALGQDTRPIVAASLEPFGQDVRLYPGDLQEQIWSGGPIGLFVDDMTKWPAPFHHALTTFGPSWVPGVTGVVLMDYLYWRRVRTGRHALQVQQRFIEANSDCFRPIEFDHPSGSTTRAFLYERAFAFDRLRPFEVANPMAKLLPPAALRLARRAVRRARR